MSPIVVDIGDIRLRVLPGNNDAKYYAQRGVFEERESRLYRMIREAGFQTFVDVGANYGFISIIAARAVPGIALVAIEADERLIPLIEENLKSNNITDARVIHAIAGRRADDTATFSLNPKTTLDNRVSEQSWIQQAVQQQTLDDLLLGAVGEGPIFIKIDTQGFEADVLSGAQRLLTERDDWMIKMEFAPLWLRWQAIEPVEFLRELTDAYEVAESPARIPYFASGIESLFDVTIRGTEIRSFVQHVEALHRDGRGWVDLLVRPAGSRFSP